MKRQQFQDFLWVSHVLPVQSAFLFEKIISTSKGKKAMEVVLQEYENHLVTLSYYLEILPNEILFTIFSHVSDVKTLVVIPQVCKKWNSVYWNFLHSKEVINYQHTLLI